MAFSWNGANTEVTASVSADVTAKKVLPSLLRTQLQQAIVATWPTGDPTVVGDVLTVTFDVATTAAQRTIIQARIASHNPEVLPALFNEHWGKAAKTDSVGEPDTIGDEVDHQNISVNVEEGYYSIEVSAIIFPPATINGGIAARARCRLDGAVLPHDWFEFKPENGDGYWHFGWLRWLSAGSHAVRLTIQCVGTAPGAAGMLESTLYVRRYFPQRKQSDENVGAGP